MYIYDNLSPGMALHHDTEGIMEAKYKVEETFKFSMTGKTIKVTYLVFHHKEKDVFWCSNPHAQNIQKSLYDIDDIKKHMEKHNNIIPDNVPDYNTALTIAEAHLDKILYKEFSEFNGHTKLNIKLNGSKETPNFVHFSWVPLIDSNYKIKSTYVGFNLLCGKAGVGKSFLINKFYEKRSSKQSIIKLAPTAIAAINIKGQTIHSFFRFPPNLFDPFDDSIITKDKKFSSFNTLIIDEISMVQGYIIDAIDRILRANNNPTRIFGGKTIIALGDLLQLEPISEKGYDAQQFAEKNYRGSYWFFDAKVFEDDPPNNSIFGKIFPGVIRYSKRQTNSSFLEFLEMIRKGKISNKTLFENVTKSILGNRQYDNSIFLVSTNLNANNINNKELQKLRGKIYSYEAKVEGDWDGNIPNDNKINLKVGAEVIFIKNDVDKKFYNGEKGTVHSLAEDSVVIKKTNGIKITVEYSSWEKIKYKYNSEINKLETVVIAKFNQLPIKLGWAITIHRCQGMTLDHITINLNDSFFAKGMLYVALSRVRSLSDIYVSEGNFTNEIIKLPDQKVIDFMKYFNFLNA